MPFVKARLQDKESNAIPATLDTNAFRIILKTTSRNLRTVRN